MQAWKAFGGKLCSILCCSSCLSKPCSGSLVWAEQATYHRNCKSKQKLSRLSYWGWSNWITTPLLGFAYIVLDAYFVCMLAARYTLDCHCHGPASSCNWDITMPQCSIHVIAVPLLELRDCHLIPDNVVYCLVPWWIIWLGWLWLLHVGHYWHPFRNSLPTSGKTGTKMLLWTRLRGNLVNGPMQVKLVTRICGTWFLVLIFAIRLVSPLPVWIWGRINQFFWWRSWHC